MPLTRVRSQLISVPTNYPITGSLSGTASYATTASFAMNGGSGGGGTLQTGSIANQTILYNVTTSQDNTITGLNLINNKWGVTVVEEWNSASVVGDAYYSSCSVLFHFSGSNGSTSIIDNGPNNVTSTVSGTTVITSSFSKFGSSSLFLGGTNGNYLTIPVVSGGPLDVNNQDFTVECYIYITATTNGLIASRYNSNAGSGNYNWSFTLTNGKLQSLISQYNNNNSYNLIAGATSVTTGSWHHVAFVRSSSFQTLFLDGNKDVSGSITVTTSDSSQAIRIGTSVNSNGSTNAPIVGYIDDFRITKGIARYTANFNTSSLEFPNTSGSLQLQTKYIGLVGGLNDSTVDYGVEKLSDSSLKIRKMSASGQPLSGSGTLSASVDRVYVNVLNYDNVSISGSINNAITSSYALTSSYTSGVGSINSIQLAKAWVNFNGTGTVAIRDSYNVSSITDNAVGQYYVNFNTAMNNANYAVVGCNATSISNFAFTGAAPDTVNRCLIGTYAGGAGSFQDYSTVQALVFSN